ncbi:MAG TPA: hypothetical protein VFF33_05840 [Ignavibacteriaceae bacterium]|nr:hypothetical protein [Ignavibacteriaceae bacterium]
MKGFFILNASVYVERYSQSTPNYRPEISGIYTLDSLLGNLKLFYDCFYSHVYRIGPKINNRLYFSSGGGGYNIGIYYFEGSPIEILHDNATSFYFIDSSGALYYKSLNKV